MNQKPFSSFSLIDIDNKWVRVGKRRSLSMFQLLFFKRKNKKKNKVQWQDLSNNHQFVTEVLEKSPSKIYVYNLKTKSIIYVNAYFAKALNYSKKYIYELEDKVFKELLFPEDELNFDKHLKHFKNLKDEGEKTVEVRLKKAGGDIRWFSLREAVFSRNEKGKPKEIIGTATDITEKKQKETEFQESKHFIKNVFDASPNDIYVVDLVENKNLFTSMNSIKTLGYTPQELKDMGDQIFPKLIHPEDLPLIEENHKKLKKVKVDKVLSIELRLKNAKGSWRWFQLNDRPFERNEKGEVTQIVGVSRDITESKELEFELKENKYFLERVLNLSPNLIYVYDLETEQRVYGSKGTLEVLGYSDEQGARWGKDFLPKTIHPEDLPLMKQHNKELASLNNSESNSIEIRFKDVNGKWRWFRNYHKVFKRDVAGRVKQVVGVAVDITEQKEAEIQLRESREFVLKITETTPNLNFVFDIQELKPVYINKAVEKTLGFTQEEFLNLPNAFSYLIHQDDQPKLLDHFQKIKQSVVDEKWTVEHRLKDKFGTWHWLLVSEGVFKRDQNGKVIQTIGIAVDITDRKNAEKSLNESRQFIRKINETVPNPIYVFDLRSLSIQNINSSVETFLGYTQEEVYRFGTSLIKILVHPEDLPVAMNYFQKYQKEKDGKTKYLELRIKAKSGEWKWLSFHDTVFQRDIKGYPTHTIGMITDITKRKEIEQEIRDLNQTLEKKVEGRTRALMQSQENLKQSENLLLLIANAIPAFVTYVDQEEKYKFANRFYEKNVANSETSITGKTIQQVLPETLYEQIKTKVQKVLAGEAQSFESEMTLKDGSKKSFSVNYIPDKSSKGEVKGFIAMGVDITSKIEYEKNLKEKNKQLKRTNTDLDNFVYTASHDLKSPVSNLEGLLRNLFEDAKLECTEGEVQSLLKMVDSSVERLKTTISELTEISRVQKHIQEPVKTLNIEDYINQFETEFSSQISSNSAKITTELGVKELRFSPKNFRSIIYNLMSNALKYRSPERDPEIEVRTKRVKDCVSLSIKDNGLGFDIAKKEKIFSMFRRLHSHVEGTGVGLYIVKRIVENEGGKIEVKSEEGKGSEFIVYFKNE